MVKKLNILIAFHMPCCSSGCPVAWLISNREDETTLTLFFNKIKQRCPHAVIHSLMTDDGNEHIHV